MTDDNKEKPIPPQDEPTSAEPRDPWTEGEEAVQEPDRTEPPQPQQTPPADQAKSGEDAEWQQNLINRLAFASLNEQRRTRRWNIFFKTVLFVYLFALMFMFSKTGEGPEIGLGPHTAVVEINGAIADNAFSNADNVVTGLRAAFKDKNAKGLVLRINSPGGSPVQAGYIYDEIVRLRDQHPDKRLYAVCTDLCASAAYYIAAAADEVYADKASIVGSIGVLMDGYGFVEVLKKLGVERRLMTAGENKAFLDPFSPLKDKHKQHMQGLLDNVHQQFITAVKNGRGQRLADDPAIFSGLVWSGEKAQNLGLVDGLGSTGYVARDIIGYERIVDYTPRPNYLDRFAEKLGVAAANAVSSAVMSQAPMK